MRLKMILPALALLASACTAGPCQQATATAIPAGCFAVTPWIFSVSLRLCG